MNDDDPKLNPELQELLAGLLDAELSDEGRERLREILRGSPQAQDEYRRFLALHALLYLDFSDGQLQLLPPVIRTSQVAETNNADASRHGEKEGTGGPRLLRSLSTRAGRAGSTCRHFFESSYRRRLAGAIAALAASILFIVWQLSPDTLRRSTYSDVASKSEERSKVEAADPRIPREQFRAIAVLGQASRARWSDPDLPVNYGASLLPGKFKLESGLIQIEMLSGASVVIEAPAEFELVSPRRIACDLGKIRAHVPSQAIGFTITTPTHSAVDLGTEFTVQVEPTGESEFQVLDGEVDLRSDHSSKPVLAQRLVAGESVRSNASGELSAISAAASSSFVGGEQMLEIAAAALRERYDGWKEFSQRIRNDPNVLVYYGFDGHEPWERVLRNDGTSKSDLLQGAIIGCQWTTGRWNGKQALEFKRTTDRVRLNVPGEFESLTFAAWLRIEGLERWLSSLMLTDGHQPGEVHWQMTDRGQLMLGVKAEVDKSHDFYSPSVIGTSDLGRWVHLACVYNGKQGYVSHVVDGVEVSRENITIPTKLRIDEAEIGNWVPQDLRNYRIRSLNGRVDEFILFSNPLSTEQIRQIFDAGKPQS